MLDFASLKPYLKFIGPAVLAVLAAVIQGLLTSTWDMIQLEIMVVGLLTATLSFTITGTKAKAIIPAVTVCIVAGIHFLFTGEWNSAETALALTGLLTALAALVIPNIGTITVSQPSPSPPAGQLGNHVDYAAPKSTSAHRYEGPPT